nr:VOC family protein [Lysinibacter cavernae]
MGHVHLKVGNLAEAEAFYSGILGFDVTSRVDGAIFYSAGGYHHHLATNTWNSEGAGERPATAGLKKLSIVVEDTAELDAVENRLDAAGIQSTRTTDGITTTDPWGTNIELTAR